MSYQNEMNIFHMNSNQQLLNSYLRCTSVDVIVSIYYTNNEWL